MECFALFVFGMAVIFALVIMFTLRGQSTSDRLNHTYRNLANRFRGEHGKGGWFTRPNVRFRYGATHALLTTTSATKRQPSSTQVMVSWPDHDLRAEIFPHHLSPFDANFEGHGVMRYGGADFRLAFLVRCNNPRAMQQFLSDGVQWQIFRLQEFNNENNLFITVENGRLLVRKNTVFTRFDQLEQFIELTLGLYDQGMLTRVVGIDFVASDAACAEPVVCNICGDEIIHDEILCHRCKTPHHRDCWDYIGKCSTYGCGEVRNVPPNRAS